MTEFGDKLHKRVCCQLTHTHCTRRYSSLILTYADNGRAYGTYAAIRWARWHRGRDVIGGHPFPWCAGGNSHLSNLRRPRGAVKAALIPHAKNNEIIQRNFT